MRTRREKAGIAFLVVWLIVWVAGMLIVLWGLVAALMAGNYPAMGFMALWLVFALFGLVAGSRKLRQLVAMGRPVPRRASGRSHVWDDDAPS